MSYKPKKPLPTPPIRAIGNSVVFRFREEVKNGMFLTAGTTVGGIYIPPSGDDSGKTARIVDVVAVGPLVEEVKVGDVIMVTPLMWSDAFTIDGISYWKTIEEHIMGIYE